VMTDQQISAGAAQSNRKFNRLTSGMAESRVAEVWRCCDSGSAAVGAASLPSAEPSTEERMLVMPSSGRLLST
jgi:hypothetical protein